MKRLCLGFLFFFLFFFQLSVHAVDGDVNQTIEELTKKISQLQQEENTLAKQISLLDSQISLTSLRINTIRSAVVKLTAEIDELAGEIERLEGLLTRRTELVLRRIPESYKRRNTSQFGMFLLSSSFSEFVSRVKYISTIQEHDAALLFQLKATQNNFTERKNLREGKKLEQEKLKKQLEKESASLARQKKEKQVLLDQTKNSEVVYQKLLAQALAEKQAVDRALIDSVKLGPVKKGDPIAVVGNTGFPGCSTGAHLHFEVRKGGSWVDPGGYLSSKRVKDDQNGGDATLGSGSWAWPLEDTIRITQYFGKTPYSWRYQYSSGIHTGFDMVSTGSNIIRAPSDGDLYSSSQACGSGSIIKIKYIEHGDGVLSFYLHVQ
ncbi:MAG: peptidoglycan DD-metalloendopeptidase family protein [Candidatus Gottesmanbacteria bacterium]|nr:peptidoglycan DD-metalloendopeptidase family protein [Candidatus Gottesmanbacteria bacterium]